MSRQSMRRYQSQCGTKCRYATQAEAEQELRRHGYTLFVYACPWGPHWHLTRQAQRRRA